MSNNSGLNVVKDIIRQVESGLNIDTKGMLMRMAWVESDFGTHKDTYSQNFVDHTGLHSFGIWQITPACLEETKTNANLNNDRKMVKNQFGIDWPTVTMADMVKPLHNCLAGCLYMKFAEKAWPAEAASGWPGDLAGQAKKWKYHFNRNAGGLSAEGFVEKCKNSKI